MKTSFLKDPGEESWVKLHLGCGGIFLEGYENIDLDGVLARERPDLVEQNGTTIDEYYPRAGTFDKLPRTRPAVVDRVGNIVDPGFAPASVHKILAVQVFEHLSPREAHTALLNWWNCLVPRGVLILSVPRMDDTLDWLKDGKKRKFAIRHLRGSERTPYSIHRAWYNPHDLEWLLESHGFDSLELLPNFHAYPAIVLKARKADRYVPDRSYQVLPGYEPGMTLLDVGPGDYPCPLATRCFDVNERYRDSRLVPADIGNVEQLLYADRSFDYVYCSHCLEHTERPAQALKELQRVGRRGYVEVPSVMLDFLAQHGNAHLSGNGTPARWMCLNAGKNTLLFVERDPRLDSAFEDRELGTWFHRLAQYQIPLSEPERMLREFFWSHQLELNAWVNWDEEKKARGVELRLSGEIVG